MNKNKKQKEERKSFIYSVFEAPERASLQLRDVAKKLESSVTTSEKVKLLSDLLYLSEETIFKDYMDCKDESTKL